MKRTTVVPSGRVSVMSLAADFQRPPPPAQLKQIAMQLKHEIRRELRLAKVRVNSVQRVAVSGDFLFGSVRRLGSLRNEIADPLRRSDHAFDSVRRLGALNDGALAECLKQLGVIAA